MTLTAKAYLPLPYEQVHNWVMASPLYEGRGSLTEQGTLRLVFGSGEARLAPCPDTATPPKTQLDVIASDEAGLQLLRDFLTDTAQDAGVTPDWQGQSRQGLPANLCQGRVCGNERIGASYQRITLEGPQMGRLMAGGLHFRLLLGPKGAGMPQVNARGLTEWPGGKAAWHMPVYTVREICEISSRQNPSGTAAAEAKPQTDGPGTDGPYADGSSPDAPSTAPSRGSPHEAASSGSSPVGRTTRLVFDIFLHDGGRVTQWAQDLALGDNVALMGPSGGDIPTESDWIALLGDETALPAIARILAALPAHCRGEAVLLVPSQADHQHLTAPPGITVRWLSRSTTDRLSPQISALSPPAKSRFVFFASEREDAAQARLALENLGLERGEFWAQSYWQKG